MSKKKDEIKSAQVSLCVYISFYSVAVRKSESELPVLKAAHKSDLFQFIHVIGSPGVIISAQADVRMFAIEGELHSDFFRRNHRCELRSWFNLMQRRFEYAK